MDVRELGRKTRVYECASLVSDQLTWSNARVITAHRNHDGEWSLEEGPGYSPFGYIHPADAWSDMDFGELPVEFFNHQLFAYDPRSEGSVRSFVETWGFPFLPLRNMDGNLTDWHRRDLAEIDSALKKTDEVRDLALVLGSKYYEEEYRFDDEASPEELEEYGEDCLLNRPFPRYGDRIPTKDEAEHYRSLYASSNPGICDAISIEEASLTLRMLQDSVSSIMDAVRGRSTVHARHLDVINMGSSYPRLLHWNGAYSGTQNKQQRYSLLTAAICNQIIDAFADVTPWRDCACEGCNVTFKRKQSGAYAPTSDSVYCCTACEERQKKRNQRAAARNRIRH